MDIERIVNKQFEMIGVPIRIKDIPEHGMIKTEKKEKYWYDVYKFESEEQYEEWRKWAKEQVAKQVPANEVEFKLNDLDLRYGLLYKYNKKGA